jgi:hypothetical protein
MARRAMELGENSLRSVSSVFWMQLRLKLFDEARETLAQVCPGDGSSIAGEAKQEMVSAPLSSCICLKAGLLAATGRESEAAQVFAAMKSLPVISVEMESSMADFYANELRDIRQATLAGQRSRKSVNFDLISPLVDGLREARLPEEISQDPEWLAIWSDPKLREMMEVYRANLTAFRNGK